ncbi:unnamed protein product [Mytilus coruscus]|uniref:SMP-30/Gluconolactonase/LRE-like region domain-containing protein n=1 Tax=Mytilus coruscus TaxID=42192 RepID=A0A6J8EPW7_MYTCO|nr:unnamed protein product [Mytilus coruscus]
MKAVEILEGNVLAIKKYATDLQSFMGIQTLKTEIEKHKESISVLVSDGSMQQIHLKYKADDIVSSVLSSKTFGTVTIEKRSSSLKLRSEKEKQAQIMSLVQKQQKQIAELALHLLLKKNLAEKDDVTVYGCTISPNGNMIFVNFPKKGLIVLNENGKLVKNINCTYNPYGVACISDESVAVTEQKSVEVINIDTEKVDKRFKLSSFPDGVIHFETLLMWSSYKEGIQRVDLEKGEVITVIKDKSLPSSTYLTTDGKHLYHANSATSVVTCYQMNGENIWEFNDVSKLKNPYGITIDNDSNIYIASWGTNSIVVLPPDGKHDRQLLCSNDGINKPRGIYYDKSRNHLLVANEKGTVFLYDVT